MDPLNDIIPSSGQSPFETIRQVRADGWLAAEARRLLEAHVYIVAFNSDLIKVGYSASPDKRIGQHGAVAARFGHALAAQWVSPLHVDAPSREKELISYCEKRGRRTAGNEYFTGLSFRKVRTYAETLAYAPASKEQVEAQATKLAAVREQWRIKSPEGRLVRLPMPISGGALTGDRDDAETVTALAQFLGMDAGQTAALPDEIFDRAKELIAEHLNQLNETRALQELANERLRSAVGLLSGALPQLQADARAALERDGLPSKNQPALPGSVVQMPVQRRIGGVR